jgi:hypothetical protein
LNYRNIWILPLLLCGGMATAAPTADALAEYRRAGESFFMLIAEAEAGEKVARLRDAEFGRLVEALSDERRMLVEGPYSSEEIETDIEVCRIANKATMSLVLFDLKVSIARSQDQQAVMAEFNALMARNILQFQDEMTALQPFLFRCLAKQMRGLERFIASLPPEQFTDVRRSGIVKMRQGISMAYHGALSDANDPAFQESYRITVLAALAETAEVYALAMPLPERKRIADAMARSAAPENGRMGAYAAQIERAFRSEACSTLCSIE